MKNQKIPHSDIILLISRLGFRPISEGYNPIYKHEVSNILIWFEGAKRQFNFNHGKNNTPFKSLFGLVNLLNKHNIGGYFNHGKFVKPIDIYYELTEKS